MIIDRFGAAFAYEGRTYHIGDCVVANSSSVYEGLQGVIFEIRDGRDKETENDTPDIYCTFDPPTVSSEIMELEARFSELYQHTKHLEDIELDYVIMGPDMIRVLNSKETG